MIDKKNIEVLIPDEFVMDYSLSKDELCAELDRRAKESQKAFEELGL
jgi:hypothetical protein